VVRRVGSRGTRVVMVDREVVGPEIWVVPHSVTVEGTQVMSGAATGNGGS